MIFCMFLSIFAKQESNHCESDIVKYFYNLK